MVLDDSTHPFKRFEQRRQAYDNSFLLKNIFGVLWCSDCVVWLVAVVVSSLLLVGVFIDGGSVNGCLQVHPFAHKKVMDTFVYSTEVVIC
jgi:Flp pilus assembly protein TadB